MRFVHNNLLPLWLTLALVAAVGSWFGAPAPVAPKAASQAAESWKLAELPANESRKSSDAIAARNLWGVQVVSNAPPPPVWTILGIARSGADRFVLLSFEGKPVETLKVGDLLPDGAKILQIDNDRFFVLSPAKKKLAFGIYKNEPAQ